MRNLCIATSIVLLITLPLFAGDYDPTREIQDIQKEIEAKGLNWIAGHTSMMDIPPEDRYQFLGLEIPESAKERFDELNSRPAPLLLATQDYFNWQEFDCVSVVDDQRSCGSCWDFAATHAFESAYLISTGIMPDFSEQQALVCNWGGSSCNGGWMEDAYLVFMNYGAVEESCMPYYANDDYPCTQDECTPVAYLDGYEDIPNNVNAIKNALMYGPLSTTFTVYDDFYGYRGGCYEHADNQPLNHAVVIVGWDDNMCDGEGAWIVKNSWGQSFGMDGFFYMKYNSSGFGQFTQRPLYGVADLPQFTFTPQTIEVELASGQQTDVNFEFQNSGPGVLRYKIGMALPEGQDEFGYYWRDSDDQDGPSYNWIDITGIGSELVFPYDQDDGNSGWLDLGFDFSFYGDDHDRIKVCTNGWATFMDGWFANADNLGMPDQVLPNDLLAAFWDDLDLGISGSAYFYTNNADTAVITWDNVADSRNETRYTFQIVLVAPAEIIYQYNSMGPERLDESTIGIENRTATMGLQVARNQSYVHDEMAVVFYLGDSNALDWLAIGSESGLVEPNSTVQLPITLDAGEHQDGIYSAVLRLLTNDYDMLVNEIPVTMVVGALDVDEQSDNIPSGFALHNIYPNPFNASTLISYSLPEAANISIEVYNVMGQKVERLYSDFENAGEHSFVWNAADYASGMYFIRLSAGDISRTERVVLLK